MCVEGNAIVTLHEEVHRILGEVFKSGSVHITNWQSKCEVLYTVTCVQALDDLNVISEI